MMADAGPVRARARRRGLVPGERAFAALFALVLAFRVGLAFQVPTDSSEVLRNLGFAAHLPQLGVRFYEALPRDFQPEPWTGVWTKRPFNYPPTTLAFFAAMAGAGLGIAWVKLALTLCDAASALLFRRYGSSTAALLFLLNPVSVFYGSHEGQFEPLQVLLIVLAAAATRRGHWFRSGLFFALGVQAKLFAILLAPWIAHRMWQAPGRPRSAALRFLGGCAAGVAPFTGFYLASPGLMLIGLRFLRGGEPFNPFLWNPLDRAHIEWLPVPMFVWMSLVTSAMVALAAGDAAWRRLSHREPPWAHAPFIAFWSVLKTTRLTALYYAIVGDAFVFCLLERRALAHALLALQLVACPRSLLLLAGAEPFGHVESPVTRAQMARCLLTCDMRSPAARP